MECSVCLSPCRLPVKLRCKHVFCYLCVKGAANLNKKCPLCRKKITKKVLERPKIVKCDQPSDPNESPQEYVWLYEGRGSSGWWRYDDVTGEFIESAFQSGQPTCRVMIAGFMYTVDFAKNMQVRDDDQFRKRRIKREKLADVTSAKGIAGVSTKWNPQLFAVPPENKDTNSLDEPAEVDEGKADEVEQVLAVNCTSKDDSNAEVIDITEEPD